MTESISISVSVNSLTAQNQTSSTKAVVAGVYDPEAQAKYPVDPPAFILSSALARQFSLNRDLSAHLSGSLAIDNGATDSLSDTARAMASRLHSLLGGFGMSQTDADASTRDFLHRFSKSVPALSNTAAAFGDISRRSSSQYLQATGIDFVLRQGDKAMTVHYDNLAFSVHEAGSESLFGHRSRSGSQLNVQAGESFDEQASGFSSDIKIDTHGLSEHEAAQWLESLSESLSEKQPALASSGGGTTPVSTTLTASPGDGLAPGSRWSTTLLALLTAPPTANAGLNVIA